MPRILIACFGPGGHDGLITECHSVTPHLMCHGGWGRGLVTRLGPGVSVGVCHLPREQAREWAVRARSLTADCGGWTKTELQRSGRQRREDSDQWTRSDPAETRSQGWTLHRLQTELASWVMWPGECRRATETLEARHESRAGEWQCDVLQILWCLLWLWQREYTAWTSSGHQSRSRESPARQSPAQPSCCCNQARPHNIHALVWWCLYCLVLNAFLWLICDSMRWALEICREINSWSDCQTVMMAWHSLEPWQFQLCPLEQLFISRSSQNDVNWYGTINSKLMDLFRRPTASI